MFPDAGVLTRTLAEGWIETVIDAVLAEAGE